MLNEFNSICIYLERDSFGAPWWEDTQDFLLGENPAISLEGIRWWVLKSCFYNFKCHVQRKNGRCQCCSRCGPRFMKFDGVNLHIPYEKSRYFWSNSQFKVSIEVVPIITPHFIATCLNLLFWHKSCLSSWTHHMQFEVFVHFSISFFGLFPGPARPIRSFLAGTCQHHLFFSRWHLKAMGSPEREGHCQCPGFVVFVF